MKDFQSGLRFSFGMHCSFVLPDLVRVWFMCVFCWLEEEKGFTGTHTTQKVTLRARSHTILHAWREKTGAHTLTKVAFCIAVIAQRVAGNLRL